MWRKLCVLSHFSHVWRFATPWTVACQAPLSMGFSRQEYWNGLPCPPPGDLPNPGIKPVSPTSPALAGRFFTPEPPGKQQVQSLSIYSDSHNRVSDAIQPSHPLSSPFPPAPNTSQHQSLFQWVKSLHEVAKVLEFVSASLPAKKSQGWSHSEWTGWIFLQSKGLSRVFSNTTVQKHQFFSAQLSSQSNSHIHTWPQEKSQPWLDGSLLAK